MFCSGFHASGKRRHYRSLSTSYRPVHGTSPFQISRRGMSPGLSRTRCGHRVAQRELGLRLVLFLDFAPDDQVIVVRNFNHLLSHFQDVDGLVASAVLEVEGVLEIPLAECDGLGVSIAQEEARPGLPQPRLLGT